jgi:hypothetical protein
MGRGLDGSRWITPNHRPFRVNSGQVLVYVKGYRGCSMPRAGMQAWRRANFCTVLSQVRKERIIQCDGESASIKGLTPSAAKVGKPCWTAVTSQPHASLLSQGHRQSSFSLCPKNSPPKTSATTRTSWILPLKLASLRLCSGRGGRLPVLCRFTHAALPGRREPANLEDRISVRAFSACGAPTRFGAKCRFRKTWSSSAAVGLFERPAARTKCPRV